MDTAQDEAQQLAKDKDELFKRIRIVLDKVKNDNIQYKVTIANQENAIKALNGQLSDEQNYNRQYVTKIDDLKTTVKTITAQNEGFQAMVDTNQLQAKVDVDSKRKMDLMEAQINQLNDEVRQMKGIEFKTALSELEWKADRKELEEIRIERDRLVARVASLEATVFKCDGACEQAIAYKALIDKQTAQNGKDMAEFNDKIKGLKAQFERLQTSDKELSGQVTAKQKTIDKITVELEECRVQLEAAEKALSAETDKLRTVRAELAASQVELKRKDGTIAELVKKEANFKVEHESVVKELNVGMKKVADSLVDSKIEEANLKSKCAIKNERINYLEPFETKYDDLRTKLKNRIEEHKATEKRLEDELESSRTESTNWKDKLTISGDTNKRLVQDKLELISNQERLQAMFDSKSTAYDALDSKYRDQSSELTSKSSQLLDLQNQMEADTSANQQMVKELKYDLKVSLEKLVKFKEKVEKNLSISNNIREEKDGMIKRLERALETKDKRYEKLEQEYEEITKAKHAHDQSAKVSDKRSAKKDKDHAALKVGSTKKTSAEGTRVRKKLRVGSVDDDIVDLDRAGPSRKIYIDDDDDDDEFGLNVPLNADYQNGNDVQEVSEDDDDLNCSVDNLDDLPITNQEIKFAVNQVKDVQKQWDSIKKVRTLEALTDLQKDKLDDIADKFDKIKVAVETITPTTSSKLPQSQFKSMSDLRYKILQVFKKLEAEFDNVGTDISVRNRVMSVFKGIKGALKSHEKQLSSRTRGKKRKLARSLVH